MGGYFGAVSQRSVASDVFFGTDYHSHLGTRVGGMAVYDGESYYREIHSIEDAPFRSKFEAKLSEFRGTSGIGCISDSDPQPLLVRSHLGFYAITITGKINNSKEIIEKFFSDHTHQFMAMGSGAVNSTELVAALINRKSSIAEGIKYAQEVVDGSLAVLILSGHEIIAARDRFGRIPMLIGRDGDGFAVSFESFAYLKLGYEGVHELGPGEIVKITKDGYEVLSPPRSKMKICAFLWIYYGYPNSTYEGVNVELTRYRNGSILAESEEKNNTMPVLDYVAGVPDSGIPHAIGYANFCHKPLARPFVKYTPTWPRSFTPENQEIREKVARMKQIPVKELIEGKRLLFVDDSIVRGTQLKETVEFLYKCGAKEVHMRSACPPMMHVCKFLNFSRSDSDMELLTRRTVRKLEGEEGERHLEEYSDASTRRGSCMLKSIANSLGFSSLGYQSLDGLLKAIGLDRDKVCTYCWTGKE